MATTTPTVPARLYGSQGLVLTIKAGSSAAVDYSPSVKSFELSFTEKDSKDLTFLEAAGGIGTNPTLKLTMVTSFDAGSLYGFLWDNPGQDVLVTLGPWGNSVPSPDKPHLQFTVTTVRPGLSNEARTDKTGADVDVTLDGTGDVVKITAAGTA